MMIKFTLTVGDPVGITKNWYPCEDITCNHIMNQHPLKVYYLVSVMEISAFRGMVILSSGQFDMHSTI